MKIKVEEIFIIIFSILFMVSSILVQYTNTYYKYLIIAENILLIYLIIRLVKKKQIKIIKNKLDVCIILLVVSTIIPLISNTYISLKGTVETILQYIYALVIYILAREIISKENKFYKIVINILIISAVATIIIGIDGITSNILSKILAFIEKNGFINGENRLISVFGYPNTFAAYISSILFLNINEYLRQERAVFKAIYKTVTLIIMIGIFLTYSKGIIILLPIVLILYLLILKDKEKKAEIINNILISFVMSIIYVIMFEKFSNLENKLLIWILFIIVVLLNYCVNLLLEILKFNIKKIKLENRIVFLVISIFAIGTIIGLNVYDEYTVFNKQIESDYEAKIINNIISNKEYVFEFDIESKSPRDIDNNFIITLIERDSKNQELNNTEIRFGTYNGKKVIKLVTHKDTAEIKIEFKSQYEFNQKELIIKKLSINSQEIPLQYKYLPTKLVEKIKNININYKTSTERIEMIKNALELSKENWLTGIGGNAWSYKYQEVQSYSYIAKELHSYPAKVVLEFGILGIISYIGVGIITIRIIVKIFKEQDLEAMSILCAFLIIALHSIIDIDMVYTHILIYVFALMGILSKKLKNKNEFAKIDILLNLLLIFIMLFSIYMTLNVDLYTKDRSITVALRKRNGLKVSSQEYKEISEELAKKYEENLDYERYNYLEKYYQIINYNLDLDNPNIEKIEQYYKKILEYENKNKYDIDSVINKIQVVNEIIEKMEKSNKVVYYEITEKFINIILEEYPKTKEQVENFLEKDEYIKMLERIHISTMEKKKNYLLGVKVINETDIEINQDMLNNINVDGSEDILIYHSHGTESYKTNESYIDYDYYKTLDENYNIIKIGKYLSELLNQKGINTIHNKEYYNYPSQVDAYANSKIAVQDILKNNININRIIDIHRDSISSGMEHSASTIEINGENVAQLRFVIGINKDDPDWLYDLKWAIEIQKEADKIYPGLFKPILIREREYNQDLSKYAILIEVGENYNYIEHALNSMKYFADVINH